MKTPRHLQSRSDPRVVTKHAGQGSVGATRRPPGHKLGKRFTKDLVGEGPRSKKGAAFVPRSKSGPKLQGAAFRPIHTGLSDADQAAAYNNSGGKY